MYIGIMTARYAIMHVWSTRIIKVSYNACLHRL